MENETHVYLPIYDKNYINARIIQFNLTRDTACQNAWSDFLLRSTLITKHVLIALLIAEY